MMKDSPMKRPSFDLHTPANNPKPLKLGDSIKSAQAQARTELRDQVVEALKEPVKQAIALFDKQVVFSMLLCSTAKAETIIQILKEEGIPQAQYKILGQEENSGNDARYEFTLLIDDAKKPEVAYRGN